jgi:hypothetical protein
MAFIGNTPQNQGFTPAIDYFNGNGVTVTFTLSRPVVSVAQMIVAIDNVIQNPSSAFTVSGNSITFTSAPLSGTNNIWVEYTSLITQYNAISQDPSVIGDITATGGYLATGDFGNTFTDGTIVDYVTGMSRITTGSATGMTFYNGGPSARNPLMTLASTGNVGIGTTSPTGKLDVSNVSRVRWDVSTSATTQITTNAAANAYAVQNNDALSHAWKISGTTAMTLDSSGRVTTPYNPAFYAYASTGIVYNNATVTLNSTRFNIGSCYSTGTGRFTAPVDGVYMFAATGRNNGSGNPILDLQHSAGYIISRLQFPGTAYYHHSLSAVTYLTANQYVYLGTQGEIEFDANGIDQFSGALIG